MATPLNNYINYFVQVKGEKKLSLLSRLVQKSQVSFVKLGVTLIFADRVIQSLTRAWTTLNKVAGVSRFSEYGADVLRMSKFMDVGTKKLQAFNSAVGTLGRDMDFTRDLLQTFNERVDEISSVQGIADDFKRIGLTAKDFKGVDDPIDRLLLYFDTLSKLSGHERMTSAEALLGGDLSVAAQLGSGQDILALMQAAIDKGHIFSDQQLKSAADVKKAFHSVGQTFTALSNNLGATLMPSLERISKIVEYIGADVSAFLSNTNEEISKGVADVLDVPLTKIEEFIMWWDSNIKDIGDTLVRLAFAAGILATVGAVMFAPYITFTLLTLLVTLLLVLGAIDDIYNYMTGMPSLLGSGFFQPLTDFFWPTIEALRMVKDAFVALIKQVVGNDVFEMFADRGGFALTILGGIVKFLANLVGVLISGFLLLIVVIVKFVVGAIEFVIGGILTFISLIFVVINALELVAAIFADMVFGTNMSDALMGTMRGYMGDFGTGLEMMGSGIYGGLSMDLGTMGNKTNNTTYNISTTDPAAATTAASESNMRMQRAEAGR